MTPHPLATWTQLTVSPQRQALRRRRRRRAAHLLLQSSVRREPDGVQEETTTPRVPLQRRTAQELPSGR
jgi:hypothetical protein